MAYIYKITNQLNGKIYVGKTLSTIESRWREHLHEATKIRHEQRPLYAAIKKYGKENFSIEPLEECSYENINERERYWIELLGSFKNGYNATLGGDGAQYADYDLIYALYKENKTYEEIAQLTSHDRKTITRALNQKGVTKEERQKNNTSHISKPVAKIDPVTDEIVEVYSSANEAERHNGNSKHISDVCNGRRKLCKGFKWKYL